MREFQNNDPSTPTPDAALTCLENLKLDLEALWDSVIPSSDSPGTLIYVSGVRFGLERAIAKIDEAIASLLMPQ